MCDTFWNYCLKNAHIKLISFFYSQNGFIDITAFFLVKKTVHNADTIKLNVTLLKCLPYTSEYQIMES